VSCNLQAVTGLIANLRGSCSRVTGDSESPGELFVAREHEVLINENESHLIEYRIDENANSSGQPPPLVEHLRAPKRLQSRSQRY
jgi:hypothetical protein